jgi:hypothetical protein
MAIGRRSGRIRQLHSVRSPPNTGSQINGALFMNQHASRNKRHSGKASQCSAGKNGRTVIALALGLGWVGSSLAGQGAQHPAKEVDSNPISETPYLVFNGSTGTVGMDAHHNDELIFADGTFHSRECQKIGFEKSTFNIARDGNEIQFSAVNVSSRYGTLTWQGVIRDGVINARYQWKKERIFWTIQREYWFNGEATDVRR